MTSDMFMIDNISEVTRCLDFLSGLHVNLLFKFPKWFDLITAKHF